MNKAILGINFKAAGAFLTVCLLVLLATVATASSPAAMARHHGRQAEQKTEAGSRQGKHRQHKAVSRESRKPAVTEHRHGGHLASRHGHHQVAAKPARHLGPRERKRLAALVGKNKKHPAKVAHRGKSASLEKLTEEPLPSEKDYHEQTQLLAQSYSLRDQALNEQLHGNIGQAVEHLRQATEISGKYYPQNSPANPFYTWIWLVLLSKPDRMIWLKNHTGKALAEIPQSVESNLGMARLLARRGQRAEAIAYAKKLVEIDASDARGHLLLSLLLEKDGQTEESQREKDLAQQASKGRPAAKSSPAVQPRPCAPAETSAETGKSAAADVDQQTGEKP